MLVNVDPITENLCIIVFPNDFLRKIVEFIDNFTLQRLSVEKFNDIRCIAPAEVPQFLAIILSTELERIPDKNDYR